MLLSMVGGKIGDLAERHAFSLVLRCGHAPNCTRTWKEITVGTEKDNIQEEDKRATTNVQHRFVPFFLLSFLLFCSPGAKTLCLKGKVLGEKF